MAHSTFSRADLVVSLACGAIAVATALPVLGRAGIDSGEARSLSNLRVLAGAHEAYSQSFNGKQYTAIPEDAGLVGGDCQAYQSSIACPPQLLLGLGSSGAMWGYFTGISGLCSGSGNPPSDCANWVLYRPLTFTGANAGSGSFRLPNAVAFNSFVDGRFYSEHFYSPNDRVGYEISARYRDAGAQFDSVNEQIAWSSYCLSPAAMYHPSTLSAANGGFKDPGTFVDAFVAPTVSQCTYPDLKTRMIEHGWYVGNPSIGGPGSIPFNNFNDWTFNASALGSPNGFFFDGHVARIANTRAIADDAAVQAAGGIGLWSRTTPFGSAGYGNATTLLESERTSHTILTIDGLLGRDLLTAQ